MSTLTHLRHRPSAPPLVVFEGLDGTGKSTLAAHVATRLGAVLLASPPAAVRPFRAAADEAFPRDSASATLFYAASVLRVAEELEGHRALGLPVVLDRYWLSTRAYARVLGVDLQLPEVERLLPRATLTVFVTAPDEVRAARLASRGMCAHDRDSLVPANANALDTAYRDLLRRPLAGRVLRLENVGRTVDELTASVLEALARPTSASRSRLRLSAA